MGGLSFLSNAIGGAGGGIRISATAISTNAGEATATLSAVGRNGGNGGNGAKGGNGASIALDNHASASSVGGVGWHLGERAVAPAAKRARRRG